VRGQVESVGVVGGGTTGYPAPSYLLISWCFVCDTESIDAQPHSLLYAAPSHWMVRGQVERVGVGVGAAPPAMQHQVNSLSAALAVVCSTTSVGGQALSMLSFCMQHQVTGWCVGRWSVWGWWGAGPPARVSSSPSSTRALG
jgi:hypothetical protein